MKKLLLFASILISLLNCTSCSHNSGVEAILQRADSLLSNSLPDSSLSVIGTIPMDKLQSEAEKARFILLYERILEGNNLPLIGEEDLRSAVEWFRERLQMLSGMTMPVYSTLFQ